MRKTVWPAPEFANSLLAKLKVEQRAAKVAEPVERVRPIRG